MDILKVTDASVSFLSEDNSMGATCVAAVRELKWRFRNQNVVWLIGHAGVLEEGDTLLVVSSFQVFVVTFFRRVYKSVLTKDR